MTMQDNTKIVAMYAEDPENAEFRRLLENDKQERARREKMLALARSRDEEMNRRAKALAKLWIAEGILLASFVTIIALLVNIAF